MADSFFGFDTSVSNLNDDEGGGEPSEDEYDALNDETFGQDSDVFDWEVEHEQHAEQIESSRQRRNNTLDNSADQLEASLSQLVLDETDAPQSRTFGSSVWRHDAPFPAAPTPVSVLKNVCTVEELERQMRQKQQQQQAFGAQNFFQQQQPRYPPVILQRPPGLQAPVPLPFAPQQSMSMNQLNQPLNKIIGQPNQMSQTNLLQNQMGQNVNQMGQSMNQIGQNMNQMGHNVNQFIQSANQMGNQFQNNQMGNNLMNLSQNMQVHQMSQSNQLLQNQMGQNLNQIGQNVKQIGPNRSQMSHNVNQMGQNMGQMGQNMNQMNPNVSPMGQNVNQMNQNANQIGQNVNQMMNGNQFNQGMNQFSHMMGQPRMMGPPPGMGMPRQNFSQNVGQYNPNFRGQLPSKPNEPQSMNQQNMLLNQQLQQMTNQSTQINQKPNQNQSIGHSNQPIGHNNQSIGHNNQPIGHNNQSVGHNNQSVGHNNQPIGHNNQSVGHNNQSIGHSNQSIGHSNQSIGHNNQPIGQQNQPIGQNQSPQNKVQSQKIQNSIQNQRVDQKMQKSRVYNNSKNMTSQNLVQLIQNTHPMLQFNNSFHNASHHPMLNNRNNMFNSQFMNNQMFNNQRHNGTYSNNNSIMDSIMNRHVNGDECSNSSDGDEYAGLMTQREKQWLIYIQMLQLNTGTPYIHDFYYTVFLERQASKEKEGIKEAHKANQQNHPFYSGGVTQDSHSHGHRERHNSTRHNSTGDEHASATPRTYVPAQFENSLGKLQCGSVTAPRKIIDVEVVAGDAPSTRVSRAPSVASTTNPAEVPREVKRTKQLLLDIEALYLILLRLEELNDPLAISNALILKEREEKQKQLEQAQKEALEQEAEDECNVFLRNIESVQRRPKPDSPKGEAIDKRQVVNLAVNQKPAPVKNLLDEDKDELVNKMFLGLLHSDRLTQMLTVRKGRMLVARFVSRVPASHARLRALWARVLRAVSSVARRDDGTLTTLAPHYRKYIQNTTGWSAILESCSLLAESFDPARTPYALTSSFTLSCVCALVEKASSLVNTPEATSNERQWSKFLKTLARALKNTSLNVAKPLLPLPETKLMYHIKQLESRSTIEILQRGRPAEFADVSKADVSEQLIKHLC